MRKLLLQATIISAGLLIAAGCTSTSNNTSSSAPKAEVSTNLSLEKIYNEGYFAGQRAPWFIWLDDGSGYTIIETRENDDNDSDAGANRRDIVFYKPDGSGRKVLVASEHLRPSADDAPISINGYSWSNDGKWALIYTNSKRVWRSNSRGDYYLLNLETKALTQLGPKTTLVTDHQDDKRGKADAAQLMFAKFSPNSQHIAYVYKNNIYTQPLDDLAAEPVALTTDGNDIVINGTFDWVYEEEFSIRDGFRWSPDSKRIAYWQLDTSGVKTFHMINNTDTLYPEIISFPYPKAGETNSTIKVGVVDLANQQTDWVELDSNDEDRYLPRMGWATANELLIQDLDRPQQVNELWLYNVKDRSLENIFTDSDSAFIERMYDAEFINDGKHFIWHSERDGWRNLYRISTDGKEIINLTPGGYDVVSMLAYNEKANTIYYLASPDNVAQRYLYKASLDGSGKAERITPAEYSGSNSYRLSKDGTNALHTHSSYQQPPTTQTIKVDGHKTIKTLVANERLKSRVAELNLPNTEFLQVNACDGTVLDAYVMTPKNLDKSKKYPILFHVYGEPAGQTVQDRWGGSGFLVRALLVQKGFIVASVDNRGTAAPKGREWRKSIYKKIGTVTAQDQADALDALAERFPFIDTERVGVFGHSGGGSSTLTLLFKHGDKFHAGVATAAVPDIGLYDTIYQERYSGHPKQDPESYYNTSAINFVEGLTGKLLLIHGTGDDNVHYQGAEKLINELVKHNKQFEFMAYPNRAHGIYAGKNTLLHRQTLLIDFFERHLLNKASKQ